MICEIQKASITIIILLSKKKPHFKTSIRFNFGTNALYQPLKIFDFFFLTYLYYLFKNNDTIRICRSDLVSKLWA